MRLSDAGQPPIESGSMLVNNEYWTPYDVLADPGDVKGERDERKTHERKVDQQDSGQRNTDPEDL